MLPLSAQAICPLVSIGRRFMVDRIVWIRHPEPTNQQNVAHAAHNPEHQKPFKTVHFIPSRFLRHVDIWSNFRSTDSPAMLHDREAHRLLFSIRRQAAHWTGLSKVQCCLFAAL